MFHGSDLHLQDKEVIKQVRQRPGLIPVDIDLNSKRLVWFDIGDHHFAESFFFVSTKRLLPKQRRLYSFTSDVTVLDEQDILTQYVYPTGFIFHMGRTGSTLLSRALARSPRCLVISEAPPQFFIWPVLQGDWLAPLEHTAENKRRYRNLLLAMGRRRRDEHQAHFIKFTTYNVLFINFIRAVFPDVPALFLYRHPAEVLIAFADQGPGWQAAKDEGLGAFVAGCSLSEVESMSIQAFHERFLGRFMAAALQAEVEGLTLSNYRQLDRRHLARILQALNYTAESGELALMQEQFDYYSKDDNQQTRFVPDEIEKQRGITDEIELLAKPRLMPLYEQMEEAANNIVKRFV
jgi:hypothetical protein